MTPDQLLIAHIVTALTLFTLVGILWRGRAHLCWSFVGYLLTGLIGSGLCIFWPEHFYTLWFWILLQGLDDALKTAIAVELSFRTFLAFPRTRPTARAGLPFLLVIVFLALVEWTGDRTHATIGLFIGLAGIIFRYRVPVDAYHKAILLGFVPYLLVFGAIWTLLGDSGWLQRAIQSANPAAYVLLMGFWVWAAWRPAPAPRAGSGTSTGSAERPGTRRDRSRFRSPRSKPPAESPV